MLDWLYYIYYITLFVIDSQARVQEGLAIFQIRQYWAIYVYLNHIRAHEIER